ncbi:hypothetical protein BDW71DRAFT_178395 [Aspergillus fruticulosus]
MTSSTVRSEGLSIATRLPPPTPSNHTHTLILLRGGGSSAALFGHEFLLQQASQGAYQKRDSFFPLRGAARDPVQPDAD